MLFGKYINKFYKKYIIYFMIGVLALITVNYFQLLTPGIIGSVIDGIIDGSLFEDGNKVMYYVRLLLIVAVVMFISRFLWRYFIIGTSAKIEADLRKDMFLHSEKLGQSYYKEKTTGGMMALFSNDISSIRQMFAFGFIAFIDIIFLTIMTFIRMYQNNATLAILVIIPVILIWILSVFVGKIMTMRVKQRQEAFENLSDFSFETVSGINVIKAFVKETFQTRQFIKVNKENQEKTLAFVRMSIIIDVLIGAIQTTVILLILGVGTYFVLSDHDFTPGDLVAFTLYFGALSWPMMAVGFLLNFSSQAKASYKRIEKFLDEKVDIIDDSNIVNKDKFEGKIEFRNLNFAYPDGSLQVLKGVSFTINKGELVGIIGKTGSGKTTIVDLLLRLYNVDENTLFIDDTDIMKIPFKQVRSNIGYVPQDNFLFSDTIANNIAFSYDETQVELQMIKEAATLALLDSNISEFENKYDTILGERGVTLSGGQKQRLSMARAFLKDPCVLIFDDSVSAVDTNTEKAILKNIKIHRKNKTTILIAHRISTVSQLDKIIVMDDGKVAAIGSHKELEQKSEIYKTMVNEQALKEEVSGDADDE